MTTATVEQTNKRSSRAKSQERLALALIAPTLIVLTIVIVIPVIQSVKQALYGQPGLDPETGFVNETEPFGMLAPLTKLYVGVRENSGSDGVTSYSVTVTRLPRVLEDGLQLRSALPPCPATGGDACRQYFRVPVGGYDILRVHLERVGDNLTYTA